MSESCNHNCSGCSSNCGGDAAPESLLEKTNEFSNVKRVIGVVSGKGGVGKSLVTSLLATTMQRKGYKTAILDADITGPSIPNMFGVHDKAIGTDDGIMPEKSNKGLSIMSINLLLQDETDPVVWRGPVIASAVKQFWTDVIWDEVDFMFVDMPPGTGDVPLTVFQSLPVDSIVVVTSPQELVGMIVGKAVKMANMLELPIAGIVENMSYFKCPNCNEKHFIFGDSHIDALAASHNIDKVARIPMSPELAAACDNGSIEEFKGDWLDELASEIEKIPPRQ